MTTASWTIVCDEAGLQPLADLLAAELRRGDVLALSGDLGAGKSTLARALIRAALDEPAAEVPSPTFTLAQTYETPRIHITHFDLYRLSDASEVSEIGFEDAVANGAVLIEWPDRATSLMGADRLDVVLAEADGGARRSVSMTGHGSWAHRLARIRAMSDLLASAGWSNARLRPMPADASSRRYVLATAPGVDPGVRPCGSDTVAAEQPDTGSDPRGLTRFRALLMDAPRQPDGPPIRDGKPYSRIAHLAEDVRPFVAIGNHLRAQGLSAPAILAHDLERGLLLLEHLGDRVFGDELARGADQHGLWRSAVDALIAMRRVPCPDMLPLPNGKSYAVPPYDAEAMQIEVELLLDWYMPAVTGAPVTPDARAEFLAAWHSVFEYIRALPKALVLRDYHSPNLLALPDRQGPARVGIIDFQDGLIGHAAYDLVSLLQDARLDVAPEIERELFGYYIAQARAAEPGFDAAGFELAYRALGAQRNTKILGIFVRLARRDGKPRYLGHIPRIWRYVERDLAHDGLKDLRAWYDAHIPPELRQRQLRS